MAWGKALIHAWARSWPAVLSPQFFWLMLRRKGGGGGGGGGGQSLSVNLMVTKSVLGMDVCPHRNSYGKSSTIPFLLFICGFFISFRVLTKTREIKHNCKSNIFASSSLPVLYSNLTAF